MVLKYCTYHFSYALRFLLTTAMSLYLKPLPYNLVISLAISSISEYIGCLRGYIRNFCYMFYMARKILFQMLNFLTLFKPGQTPVILFNIYRFFNWNTVLWLSLLILPYLSQERIYLYFQHNTVDKYQCKDIHSLFCF